MNKTYGAFESYYVQFVTLPEIFRMSIHAGRGAPRE
jgi:hypothetical protein